MRGHQIGESPTCNQVPMGADLRQPFASARCTKSSARFFNGEPLPKGFRAGTRTSRNDPSPIGWGIRALCLPLEKFLKQRIFFLIAHLGIRASCWPFFLLGRAAFLLGKAAGGARRLGRARRLRRSRLFRLRIGHGIRSRRSRLPRSAARRGTGRCCGSRDLFCRPRLDLFPGGRIRQRPLGADPFGAFGEFDAAQWKPFGAILC